MNMDSKRALGAWVCLSAVLAVGGCVDRGSVDDDGDGSGEASAAAATEGDDAAEPGSAGGNDSDDTPPDPTAGDPTAGDPPEPPQVCLDACNGFVACFPDEGPTLERCVADCMDSFAGASAECQAATLDLIECISELECDAWFEDEACGGLEDAIEEHCDDRVCSVGVGGGDDECGASYQCPGEPLYLLECDEAQCRCYEDDVEVGGCASEGICMQGPSEQIFEHAETCCGWPL